ncbi:MAG TPA: sugar ABC transporter ATP-binding protein [Vicinamibacterales bacterium]|jgi:simple sugar transport system ATP-binding protein|nr:sugar ABC transporter ATP-binding protein [Vicinamibacterales bacterium]HWB16875.1 sugar ABC transporter ATP-binding protein [Vicinamibacterales bacterium]
MTPRSSDRPFLSLTAIGKSFGGVRALDDVSLDVSAGEIHCLAGENGSGKSTLIKVIAGVHRPDRGSIAIAGQPVASLTPISAVRQGVQVIYQDLSLFPNLTVAENLAINSLVEHRRTLVRWRDVRRTAEHALERLRVSIDLDRLVGDLPIAEKQLVAIARALLQDARLIVLDEPTTALTGVEVDALFALVRDLQQRGVAILFVTHKMREMLQAADRFTVLRNGRVVESGPAAEFDEARLTHAMTGRAIGETRFDGRVDASAPPRLRIRDLTGPILRGVTFDVRPGEIVGLTGLLGAGQGELAARVAGLETSGTGEIAVDGAPLPACTVRAAARAGIGYVPEDRLREGLFLDRSIADNANASSLRALTTGLRLLSTRRMRSQADRWIHDLGVKAPSIDAPVRQLSGGNQQRVVLARVLATRPKVLVLNGPTVGVDVGAKEEIHATIRQLAAGGLAVLIVSDDLPELVQSCSRVLVFRHGRVTAELGAAALTGDALQEQLSAAH